MNTERDEPENYFDGWIAERYGERFVPPASLVEFTAIPRFEREVQRLAREEGVAASRGRAQLLAAMAAMAQLPGRFDELDWHRVLDVLVLLRRPR